MVYSRFYPIRLTCHFGKRIPVDAGEDKLINKTCVHLMHAPKMKSNTTIRALTLAKKANGISTAQIAGSLNVSQRTIQRWLKQGNRQAATSIKEEADFRRGTWSARIHLEAARHNHEHA